MAGRDFFEPRNLRNTKQTAEKPAFEKLVENVHMQGFRNSEERGVRRSTPQ
jgi:hypothetical protein